MKAERIAIVGAGPAGLATARAYREHGGEGEVTLIGTEPLLPYRRPPLTKEFLRGELAAEALRLEQQEWFERQAVQLRLGRSVSAIDPGAGAVVLAGHGGQGSDEDGAAPVHERLYADAIVLATGSEPLRPKLPGLDDERVLTMRTLPDSVDLIERSREQARIVVIGTGFIGCEIAASLALRGAGVTLIGEEPLPQCGRLGEQVGGRIAGWLSALGVQLLGGEGVRGVDQGRVVELEDGTRIEASSVVLGMGARPRVELARAAGLALEQGAVTVDGSLCVPDTSGSAILAAGDIAYAYNASAGRRLRVEHWGDALEQGEIAGRVLAGEDAVWDSVPGFWSTLGSHTLKYAAWGDGHDTARLEDHGEGAFTVWYSREGALVGVLTHECDSDYECGRELIRAQAVNV
ncbi:MAG TPA: FAD-dependent oxidoreductase [Solirubrobacteraceae bacterium]|nr:FAD-dependent oxidoreductase [Solirubrobacteraceae bacterium]